jgi:membrane associated rhomboid family serine protease
MGLSLTPSVAERWTYPRPVRRVPWLTLSVTLVTAAVSLTQLAVPQLLERLGRTPAARHGESWRLLTSMLVQDGGVAGTVFNLGGLVVLGVLAERVDPRLHWAMAYLGAGLVGELAGLWWQPSGGGNSVAVCGLAGLLSAAVLRVAPELPPAASFAVLVWVLALLSLQAPGLAWPVLVAAVLLVQLGMRLPRLRYVVRATAPLVALATAAVLVTARDIHGAALSAGLLLAGVLTWRSEDGPRMAG